MRAFVPVILLVLGALGVLPGCASQQLAQQRAVIAQQTADIDSLRAANRWYRARLTELTDSLGFYDAVATGRYFRERRTLNDEITRLSFALAVAADGGRPVTTLLADDLFEPATATLTEPGAELLDLLAERLTTDFAGRPVRIEGHSDSVPLGPGLLERYPSNWELSAARAGAVVRRLVEAGVEPERLALVGRGDVAPAATNATAAGRRQNRRIRVLVLPEAPAAASAPAATTDAGSAPE